MRFLGLALALSLGLACEAEAQPTEVVREVGARAPKPTPPPILEATPYPASQPHSVALAVGAGPPVLGWIEGGQVVVGIEHASGRAETRSPASKAKASQLVLARDGEQVVALWRMSEGKRTWIAHGLHRSEWEWFVGADEALSAGSRSYEPQVQARGGGFDLIWNERVDENFRVAHRRLERDGLGTSRLLSAPVYFSNAPKLASGGDGRAGLTWYQSVGGPLEVFVILADTHEFEAAKADEGWHVGEGPATYPEVAVAPDGRIAVAWVQVHDPADRGPRTLLLAQRSAEGEWTGRGSGSLALSEIRARIVDPKIAFDEGGTLWASWTEHEGDARAVLAARVTREGEMERVRLSDTKAWAIDATLAVGGDQPVVAWREKDTETSWTVAATALGQVEDSLSFRSVPLSAADRGVDQAPVLAAGENGLAMAWTEERMVRWVRIDTGSGSQ